MKGSLYSIEGKEEEGKEEGKDVAEESTAAAAAAAMVKAGVALSADTGPNERGESGCLIRADEDLPPTYMGERAGDGRESGVDAPGGASNAIVSGSPSKCSSCTLPGKDRKVDWLHTGDLLSKRARDDCTLRALSRWSEGLPEYDELVDNVLS